MQFHRKRSNNKNDLILHIILCNQIHYIIYYYIVLSVGFK